MIRPARPIRPARRSRVAGPASLAVLAALLAGAGCARKDDPIPPADAQRSEAPRLSAPGVVADPIRDRTE
ncbi:MAG: hypothetical protein CML46_15105 [Rhodobacteraceae bacterium]|nr:hypothetical protein [Paracoccaceae bacterium]